MLIHTKMFLFYYYYYSLIIFPHMIIIKIQQQTLGIILCSLKINDAFLPAAHQEGTETVEAEEVEDSKVGPAGVLLSWQVVGLGVTLLPIHRSHHDLLPSLSSSTSEHINHSEILTQFLTLDPVTFEPHPGSDTHRNNMRTA